MKISYLLQIDKNKLLHRDIVIYDCIYHRTSYTGVAVTDRPGLRVPSQDAVQSYLLFVRQGAGVVISCAG